MNKRALLAVLFPLVVMLAWTAELTYLDRTGLLVDLEVVPYDPRDLLSGQYLQYRVVYGPGEACEGKNAHESQCLCLDAQPEGIPSRKSWSGACSDRPETCRVFLKGTCHDSVFTAGIERFYFAEHFADELRQAPKDSTIRVRINARGGALVTQFLVGNRPLADWLKDPR